MIAWFVVALCALVAIWALSRASFWKWMWEGERSLNRALMRGARRRGPRFRGRWSDELDDDSDELARDEVPDDSDGLARDEVHHDSNAPSRDDVYDAKKNLSRSDTRNRLSMRGGRQRLSKLPREGQARRPG